MYGIVHTSNVKATRVGHASSVIAPVGGLENGMVVTVGDLAVGETDIRDVSVVDNDATGKRVALIASPEVIPGEDRMATRMLGAFHMKEGEIGDAYELSLGDEFEVSDNLVALTKDVTTIENAKYLVIKGMKYEVATSAPATGIALKVNRVFDATAKRMFNKGLAYKLVHVTVERI